MKKSLKYLIGLLILLFAFYSVAFVIQQVNVKTTKDILNVEAYDIYDPNILFKDYLTSKSSIQEYVNVMWRDVDLEDQIFIRESHTFRIIDKSDQFKTKNILIEVKGVDTIPPIIVIHDFKEVVVGGQRIQNAIDLQVFDYRYGAYDFELPLPTLDYIPMTLGVHEIQIEAHDLANNKSTETLRFEVIPYVLSNEEVNTDEVWITKSRAIPVSFYPSLKKIPTQYTYHYTHQELRPHVVDAFTDMVDAMNQEEKLWIYAVISFVDSETLEEIYEEDNTKTMPNHCEHQSGLALDVRTIEHDLDTFDKSKEYEWLLNNSHRYGFIIRYEKDKEHISQFSYKPYHLRYVGLELANYLHNNNLSLDEYMIQNME